MGSGSGRCEGSCGSVGGCLFKMRKENRKEKDKSPWRQHLLINESCYDQTSCTRVHRLPFETSWPLTALTLLRMDCSLMTCPVKLLNLTAHHAHVVMLLLLKKRPSHVSATQKNCPIALHQQEASGLVNEIEIMSTVFRREWSSTSYCDQVPPIWNSSACQRSNETRTDLRLYARISEVSYNASFGSSNQLSPKDLEVENDSTGF